MRSKEHCAVHHDLSKYIIPRALRGPRMFGINRLLQGDVHRSGACRIAGYYILRASQRNRSGEVRL